MSGSEFERENIGTAALSATAASKPADTSHEEPAREFSWRPPAEGLYDPSLEKDSCGVGFIKRKAAEIGFQLPEPGDYAIGALFLPKETAWRRVIQSIIAEQIKAEGLMLLGWRDVPSDNSSLGETVKPTEPYHMQVFIGRNGAVKTADEFERRLYILRKSISQAIYQRR